MPSFWRASVFFVAAAISVSGIAAQHAICEINRTQVEALWKDYVVAQKRLQIDVANLLGDRWPELDDLARLQRDQQFAMMEMRNMKFQYLLVYDPDRIVYDDGLSRFANFEWNDEDSEALREINPDFAKLERWAEINAERLSDHPDRTRAGERFTLLQRDDLFQALMGRYQDRMDDLESALDAIDRADRRSERHGRSSS